MLHKSNAWSDQDCERNDCLICSSCTDNEKKGLCMRRNVVYETFCLTCHYKEKADKEIKILEETSKIKEKESLETVLETVVESSKKEKKRKRTENRKVEKKVENVKREFKVKYVGESGRSGYERSKEHVSDFKNLVDTSHLLKHYVLEHQKEMKLEDREG